MQYVDPRILRSRYKTALEFDQLTDGRFRYASLERPFFSYDTRVAYGASGFDNLSTDHLYDEGETIRLQPANSTMGPIRVAKPDLEIQGRVLAVLRKYR